MLDKDTGSTVLLSPGDRQKRGLTKGITLLQQVGAVFLTMMLVATLLQAQAFKASAATVYELEGSWADNTPTTVKSSDVVSTVWRYNINDDAAAPSNDPVDNVTFTFTAQNALFTQVPKVCLTEGVSPASGISADKKTLTCNLGTRNQGTAELLITGLQVKSPEGGDVQVTGSIGGVSEDLPPLKVSNVFAMDFKIDGTSRSWASTDGFYQEFDLPWSLRHSPDGIAGPSSVKYTLDFSSTVGTANIEKVGVGCFEQSKNAAEYPYSTSSSTSSQRAPFPTCTLTKISTNKYELTLSNLDYSKAILPSKDSRGVDLPTEWDVIAAGMLSLYFVYDKPDTVSVKANAPTYTAANGATSVDNPNNNSNAINVTRGSWTGGWQPQSMVPRPIGSYWNDTFRQLAGGPVRQAIGAAPPTSGENQLCSILDTKYVTFDKAIVGASQSDGTIAPDSGITYWYYIGNNAKLTPNNAGYDPNTFSCDTEWGSNQWVSTPPADKSQVKAVRAHMPVRNYDLNGRTTLMLYVDSTIKSNVADGQDIWQWGSYKRNGSTTWVSPNRELDTASRPNNGVLTPDSRYPFTGGGRDVMRVISSKPVIVKDVEQKESLPGAVVDYVMTYRAEAATDMEVQNYEITDVLPAGVTYVPSSATPAPTSINGQTLKWVFPTIQTNTDYVIRFSARLPESAEPGAKLTNTVTAKIGTRTANSSATTIIRENGLTMLTKSVEEAIVPHDQGAASDTWIVRITSEDSKAQTFTDTIDVLPYNGDGRGTDFSGTYKLSGPIEAVDGAQVYYTTAAPSTVKFDPADPSNGAAGDISGNTVNWSTTYTAEATAVRVIGPSLAPSASQEFRIPVITDGATHEDVYVNVAEARAERTKLIMRTSSKFEIGAVNSVALKKYVQDSAGQWRDANDVDDYPQFFIGDTVRYRLVVTNTGDEVLRNVSITDDKVDLAGLKPLPEGLIQGAVIEELLPGKDNAKFIEYEVVLNTVQAGSSLVNTACAVPEDTELDESCDPAGLVVDDSSLAWEKIAAGTEGKALAGSEWTLVAVDAERNPIGQETAIVDCVESDASACQDADQDPAAGKFLIEGLKTGTYRLIETKAPAGYVLDETPRYIDVRGESSFESPIVNEQADVPTIPLTGGIGSYLFTGAALACVAAVIVAVLFQRRRTRSQQ